MTLREAMAPDWLAGEAEEEEKDEDGEQRRWLAAQQAGEYDRDAVRAALEAQIASEACLVFGFSDCPFCTQARHGLSGGHKAVALAGGRRPIGLPWTV